MKKHRRSEGKVYCSDYPLPGMSESETHAEARAIESVRSVVALRRRLYRARDVLSDKLCHRFRKLPAYVDAEHKRLVSIDGLICLQWATRVGPRELPSAENQQSTLGCVRVLDMVYVMAMQAEITEEATT